MFPLKSLSHLTLPFFFTFAMLSMCHAWTVTGIGPLTLATDLYTILHTDPTCSSYIRLYLSCLLFVYCQILSHFLQLPPYLFDNYPKTALIRSLLFFLLPRAVSLLSKLWCVFCFVFLTHFIYLRAAIKSQETWLCIPNISLLITHHYDPSKET